MVAMCSVCEQKPATFPVIYLRGALSPEQVEAEMPERKAEWFRKWPSGTRYVVRCLDGGAWDRSTDWGMVASLEDAIAKCAAGPVWRRQVDAMSDEVRAALGMPVGVSGSKQRK